MRRKEYIMYDSENDSFSVFSETFPKATSREEDGTT